MIALDTEHMNQRNKWEDEIAELERQIALYREGEDDRWLWCDYNFLHPL